MHLVGKGVFRDPLVVLHPDAQAPKLAQHGNARWGRLRRCGAHIHVPVEHVAHLSHFPFVTALSTDLASHVACTTCGSEVGQYQRACPLVDKASDGVEEARGVERPHKLR